MRHHVIYFFTISLISLSISTVTQAEDLLRIDNGVVQIGIDREKGAAITWLSWKTYPKNMVNSTDPGRLIQQSYYAGHRLDRTADGQSKSWSPWSWNPIQGGGVGSWARVTEFKHLGIDKQTLYSETIPKLWDMPNEEADALMRQWTSIEPSMPNVVVVKCELICKRDENDRWGPARLSPQEIPACYFTRNFDQVKSYLGDGKWRDESQPPGPPWGQANPPRKAMACFEAGGQGVAIFSPASTLNWNFGPHGKGLSDDPVAGPCMHVAPLDRVLLGPKSTYSYRYWLIVGTKAGIAARLDSLWEKHAGETAKLTSKTYTNPLNVAAADPFVFFENGTYYLYGSGDYSIPVWTSKDLVNWKRKGKAFERTENTWTQVNYWSPEVFRVGTDYYLTFNASPNKEPGHPFNEQLCIAKGSSPLGPFVEWKTPFYKPEAPDEAIDQSFFFDDDGKAYLVFTQVIVGRNDVRVVKLKDNLCEFDGEPVVAIVSTEPWESRTRNNSNHKVAEGAYMLKHDGYYYLLYTANDFRDPNYSIGYATSKSPLGPWKKHEGNPILSKTDQIQGTGNGMIVRSPDGKERFLVYHTHNKPGQVSPRRLAMDRVYFKKVENSPDVIVVNGPTSTPQPLPSGAK